MTKTGYQEFVKFPSFHTRHHRRILVISAQTIPQVYGKTKGPLTVQTSLTLKYYLDCSYENGIIILFMKKKI